MASDTKSETQGNQIAFDPEALSSAEQKDQHFAVLRTKTESILTQVDQYMATVQEDPYLSKATEDAHSKLRLEEQRRLWEEIWQANPQETYAMITNGYASQQCRNTLNTASKVRPVTAEDASFNGGLEYAHTFAAYKKMTNLGAKLAEGPSIREKIAGQNTPAKRLRKLAPAASEQSLANAFFTAVKFPNYRTLVKGNSANWKPAERNEIAAMSSLNLALKDTVPYKNIVGTIGRQYRDLLASGDDSRQAINTRIGVLRGLQNPAISQSGTD